jgi:hypothetical protein
MVSGGVPEVAAKAQNLGGGATIVIEEDETAEGITFDDRLFFAAESASADPDQEHLRNFFC